MQVTVKLFSVLRDRFPDYDPKKGIVVDAPGPLRVDDLVRRLAIPDAHFPVVSCNGRILQRGDPLEDGAVLHIFQPVAGG